MFGIDGIEFLIILIVMIVVVGPKDLPKMMRAFGQATTKMRKTAMEFRRHFDEAMREAELDELSDTLKEVKKLDPRKNLTEIFDPIREVTSDIKASLEQLPKNVERFSDKSCGKTQEAEHGSDPKIATDALAEPSTAASAVADPVPASPSADPTTIKQQKTQREENMSDKVVEPS